MFALYYGDKFIQFVNNHEDAPEIACKFYEEREASDGEYVTWSLGIEDSFYVYPESKPERVGTFYRYEVSFVVVMPDFMVVGQFATMDEADEYMKKASGVRAMAVIHKFKVPEWWL